MPDPTPQPCRGLRDMTGAVRPVPMCATCERYRQSPELRQAGAAWLTPAAYIGHDLTLICQSRVAG